MNRLLKVILVIILALVPVLGLVMTGCSAPPPAQGPQVGKLAPDFQLPGLDEQTVSLRDFRGKPVLINFWASWCAACRFEMPLLQEIFEDKEWSDSGLVILGINLGESPSRVKGFMENFGLSFPVLLATSQDVAREYNVQGLPATFFIDKDGIIQDIKIGAFSSKAEIERRLDKIIP